MNQRSVYDLAAELNKPFPVGPYSTNRYGRNWGPCIKMLRKRGCTDDEIKIIIYSKWPRWAADMSDNRYGRHTSADLARFLDSMPNWKGALKDLMEQAQ